MGKKKKNLPLKVLGLLFIVFMALYIASTSGYYESKIRDKVVLTEEGIKEFERRVQNGEDVDISAFLNQKRPDYSSYMSTLGDNLTSGIEVLVYDGARFVKDIINSLF